MIQIWVFRHTAGKNSFWFQGAQTGGGSGFPEQTFTNAHLITTTLTKCPAGPHRKVNAVHFVPSRLSFSGYHLLLTDDMAGYPCRPIQWGPHSGCQQRSNMSLRFEVLVSPSSRGETREHISAAFWSPPMLQVKLIKRCTPLLRVFHDGLDDLRKSSFFHSCGP